MSKKIDKNKKKKKKRGSRKQGNARNPNSGNVSNESTPPDAPINQIKDSTTSVSDDSNKSNWLNRIIDFIRRKKILAGILAIIAAAGTILTLITFFEKGKFVATINGETLDSSTINRTYLVLFEKETANLLKFKEFPCISNPARYSLNDIDLKYKIYADSLTEISFRNDYDVEESSDDNEEIYKEVTYSNDKIKQGETIHLPFRSFKMKDKGEVIIDLTATYSGYKKPFVYHTHIYSKKVYQQNKTKFWETAYNEALSYLESKNDFGVFNLRYIDKEILPEHNNLTIDLLREKVALYYNTSFSEDSIDKKPDSIEVNGTMYPVQEEEVMGEMFTQNAKSDEKPISWYMYLIGVLLGFVFIIGLYVSITRILHYERSNNTLLFVFEILGTVIASYIALLFAMRILFVSFEESSSLWIPLASLYIGFLGLLVISSLFDKWNKDKNSPFVLKKEDIHNNLDDMQQLLKQLELHFKENDFKVDDNRKAEISEELRNVINHINECNIEAKKVFDSDSWNCMQSPTISYLERFKLRSFVESNYNDETILYKTKCFYADNEECGSNRREWGISEKKRINSHKSRYSSDSINNSKQVVIDIIWMVLITAISVVISIVFSVLL